MLFLKENMTNLIISPYRDIKSHIINLFVSAGFEGENKMIRSMSELQRTLHFDDSIRNIVIDGELLVNDMQVLPDFYRKVLELSKGSNYKVLLYLAEHQINATNAENHGLKNLLVAKRPFLLKHFNEIFNGLADGVVKKVGVAASKYKLDRSSEVLRRRENRAMARTILTAAEASKHLLNVFDSMNLLVKDKSRKDHLETIGQSFNGLYGTFMFYGDKPGWGELKQIGSAVESITKTYVRDGAPDQISSKHFRLLAALAKVAFQILQTLREKAGIEKQRLDTARELLSEVAIDKEINKSDRVSQSEVDDLMEQF